MKKIFAAMVLISLAWPMASYAQTAGSAPEAAPAPQAAAVDAGNKSCPIHGEPVDGKDFVVYKGYRYGLCCKECAGMFLKDPNKYIQKLREKGEIK